MVRYLDEVAFFLLPFGAFALYLVLRRRRVTDPASWHGAKGWLALLGVAGVIAALVLGALANPPGGTAYEPAHLDANGRLVPGRVR